MSDLRLAPLIGRPSRVKDVRMRPFAPDDPTSPKGSRTWNMLYPDDIRSGRTMVAKRLRGELVGDHFHPRHPNKDPERFLLISGNIRFFFEDIHEKVRIIPMNADVRGPLELDIPPYLLHRMDVVSEVAWFLEQQADVFDPTISYTRDEFHHFRSHYGRK